MAVSVVDIEWFENGNAHELFRALNREHDFSVRPQSEKCQFQPAAEFNPAESPYRCRNMCVTAWLLTAHN